MLERKGKRKEESFNDFFGVAYFLVNYVLVVIYPLDRYSFCDILVTFCEIRN